MLVTVWQIPEEQKQLATNKKYKFLKNDSTITMYRNISDSKF